MKLAITMSRFSGTAGGAQKVMIGLANYLAERGHQVKLISFEPESPPAAKAFYPLAKNVSMELVVRPFHSSLSRQLGPQTMSASSRDETLWYDQQVPAFFQLSDILTNFKPDLVITSLPNTFNTVTKLLAGTGLPFIIANQGDPNWDYTPKRFTPNSYDVKIRNQAPKLATANIVLIEAYRQFFGPAVRAKTSVIANPVDLPDMKPRLTQPRRPIVLSVGRLMPVKNLHVLIRAFAQVADKHPKWQLHIYGEGKLKNRLQKLIVKLDMSHQIFLKGVTENISQQYQTASIYAQPSIFEGFSLALIEALYCGLPAVVIKNSTSNNSVIKKSGGGLSSANSVLTTAANLDKLMSEPRLRQKLGAKAHDYATNFTADKIYAQWERLLSDLSKNHKPTDKDFGTIKAKPIEFERHLNGLLLKAIKSQKTEIERQKKMFQTKKKQIQELQDSRAYRLGNKILAPGRKFRSTAGH